MKNLLSLLLLTVILASCASEDNPYMESLNKKGFTGDPCFPVNAEGDSPRQAVLHGSRGSENLVGTSHTDDVLLGRGGGDLYMVTLGTDLLLGFDPHTDLLDIGHLGRSMPNFKGLNSLADLKNASKEIQVDGTIAVEIDVDGDLGHSTTTLLGVSLSDITELNVFFDSGATAIPPLVYTDIVERQFIYPSGDTLAVAHGVCKQLEG